MDIRTDLGWALILGLAIVVAIVLGLVLRRRALAARRETAQDNFIWVDRQDGERPR